jgi:dephospho-CoA kinase
LAQIGIGFTQSGFNVNKQQFTVGLTGGIGSGKSTVAKVFNDLGVRVVDADQASRAVVEPGTEALEAIRNHFSRSAIGADILLSNGQLNRAALREIIFADLQQKKWLEQLLHPLIREWITTQLQTADGEPYVILESPLLLETNQHRLVDGVLLVDVPPEIQLERAGQRDGRANSEIQAIIDSQMSREDKCRRADWIFDNSQPIKSLTPRVLELHQTFLNLAG